MKPALQLRLHQQLALTPQLQQAIRLLQLSRAELEVELGEALETNPLLEIEEPEEATDEAQPDAAPPDADETPDAETDPFEGTAGNDLPLDLGHEHRSHAAARGDEDDREREDADTEDLRDHLLWQLNLTPMSPRDRAIATALIEAIDDDGYLGESNAAICASLHGLYRIDEDEVEAVRHRIQRFDPLGVGSRSLRECLGVQLETFTPGTPGLGLARRLVEQHLDDLARQERSRLCQVLGVDAEALDAAITLIRSLAPRPGSSHVGTPPEYIVPDAYASRVGGRWQVSLAPGCQPRLTINEQYSALVAQARGDDATYLRGQLQEARWLIKSLKARAETLLKVAGAIVRAQEGFLDFGPEAMRPLVLKDIADEIGMHESTVSRVTTRKYLHTPRGTLEFKYFFSSGVATADGGAASATAIQAMIRKLIGEEIPRRPLSDQALAHELNRRGISVARRTVAKYREGMNIPSSADRCRLG
jgi:RNA polymerase sigma-54 factor